MPFVIDASTALCWCFEDESNAFSQKVLVRIASDSAIAPAIWPLQVANALIVAERRGRLTEAQTARFVQLLGQLPIDVDAPATSVALGAVLTTARAHRLSSYDASYVEVAERHGLRLATLDSRLREGATAAGVRLVE